MDNWRNYIESKPDVMYGKAVIKGIRIPVDLIFEKMSFGRSIDELLNDYPQLNKEAILACLSFASETLSIYLYKRRQSNF